MQNKFVRCLYAVALLAGCASPVPQNLKINEGISSHMSDGINVYVSKKDQEVRAGLLNESLNILTQNSLYLSVVNHGTTPVSISLNQFELERHGHPMRLRPFEEVLENQEKLTNDAISDSKLPKFFHSIGDQLHNEPRSEVKEATEASLATSTKQAHTASQDPILDDLAQMRISDPAQAQDSKQVLEAHKKIVAGLSKYYFKPATLAPGESVSGFIKYEPPLAPTENPLQLTVTLDNAKHVFTIAP